MIAALLLLLGSNYFGRRKWFDLKKLPFSFQMSRLLICWCVLLLLHCGAARSENQPNFLWITAEDMSSTLGCYGDPQANTPHLDAFAKSAINYSNAFAAAPVCSPSRSCLITGVLPGSLGTHHMRSAFPVPETVHGFPFYLRKAGYFCTNNVKTDYNTATAPRLVEESWDESSKDAHWRNPARKPGQPFFAVFNDMRTHQSRSMTWPYQAFQERVQSEITGDQVHQSGHMKVPPYYPDTPIVRRELARYYDCVSSMDQQVGRILAELEADGLAEDTIVFFYSDHGSGMPRHKRLLYDTGMKVPLLVKFPKKYQHLAVAPPGSMDDRLVQFDDFGPTVLHLAGLGLPQGITGKPFLGPGRSPSRKYIYGTRDRVDEAFDTARSLRDERFLYIRNYLPHLSYSQASVFCDVADIQAEINRVNRETPESLSSSARSYANASRSWEEFYDCKSDPLNEHNLIGSSRSEEEEAALERMRRDFATERKKVGDLGALPESQMWDWIRKEKSSMREIADGKTTHSPDLDAAWAAADLVGLRTPETFGPLLDSEDPAVRYWGIIGLRNASVISPEWLSRVAQRLHDPSSAVRLEAASWLGSFEVYREDSVTTLVTALEDPDWWVALRACRGIEQLGPNASSALGAVRSVYERNVDLPGDGAMFLAFSSSAFLKEMGEPIRPWDFSKEPAAGKP